MTQVFPHELTLHTTDSLGRDIDLKFGFVTDVQGKRRMAVTIGENGPSAMLNFDDGTGPNLLPIARRTLAELIRTGTP